MPEKYESSLQDLLRIQKYHVDRLKRFGDRGEQARGAYADLMTIANAAGRESLRNAVRSTVRLKAMVKDERPFSRMRSGMKKRLAREIKGLKWIVGEGPLVAISREGSDYASGTVRYQHIPEAARTAFALGARTEAGFMLTKAINESKDRSNPEQMSIIFWVEQRSKDLTSEYEGAVFWLDELECESPALFEAADKFRKIWPDWRDNIIPDRSELAEKADHSGADVSERLIKLQELVTTEGQSVHHLFDLEVTKPFSDWSVENQQLLDAVFCQLSNSEMTVADLNPENLKRNIRDVHRLLLDALATDAIDEGLREVADRRVHAIESNIPQYPLRREMFLDWESAS